MGASLSDQVDINPRNRSFDLHAELATLWHGGDVFRTAFFNALSMQFPRGEHNFIESVRAYRDEISGESLKQQVRAFIGQEGFHNREHQRYNDALVQRYGEQAMAKMEKCFGKQMDFVASLSRSRRLAGTCAAEHYTAVMAHMLLTNPACLEGVGPEMTALWHWHAVEEVEHKAVAFDVFQQCLGNQRLRRIIYLFVSYNFFKHTLLNTIIMLRVEGKLWSLSTWVRGLNFLWGMSGLFRHALPQFLAYMRRDFHPWNYDDRELIAQWKVRYETPPQTQDEAAA